MEDSFMLCLQGCIMAYIEKYTDRIHWQYILIPNLLKLRYMGIGWQEFEFRLYYDMNINEILYNL